MVVIETANDKEIIAKVTKQVKSLYNKKDLKHTSKCPGWARFFFVPWYGDSNSPICTGPRLNLIIKARNAHVKVSKMMRSITIPSIEDLYEPMEVNGVQLTLEKILMGLRTSTDYRCGMIQQVGVDRRGQAVEIVHNDEFDEANAALDHIYTLVYAKFGRGVERWFTHEAICEASHIQYEFSSKRIIDSDLEGLEHIVPSKVYRESEATMLKVLGEDYSMEEFEALDDVEDQLQMEVENQDQEDSETTFDLRLMFQNQPPTKKQNFYTTRSHHSFTTDATSAMLEQEEKKSHKSLSMNDSFVQRTEVSGKDE